jgi:leucyl/phenylalanyl-tRNA---protein transferase
MLSDQDLIDSVQFPNPTTEATEDGIVAIGGNLSPEFLISAYRQGVFPWFNPGQEMMWWSPDPRAVLYWQELKISKTMRQWLKKNTHYIKLDTQFLQVMKGCQKAKRKGEKGTWISKDILSAYFALHQLGISHSVEVYNQAHQLVGGLYGTSMGKVFYGESMFANESNTSKYAFIFLVNFLKHLGFHFLDCQVTNPHLESLGAVTIDRKQFLEENSIALNNPTLFGKWTDLADKFGKEFENE